MSAAARKLRAAIESRLPQVTRTANGVRVTQRRSGGGVERVDVRSIPSATTGQRLSDFR